MAKGKILRTHVKSLKTSEAEVGQLLPIIIGRNGVIIDGEHRFACDKSWKVMRLELDEFHSALARLTLNAVRKPPSSVDFNTVGSLLLAQGVKPGRIVARISELTGLSRGTVAKYLSPGLKIAKPIRHNPAKTKKSHEETSESFTEEPSVSEIVEETPTEAVVESVEETSRANEGEASKVSEPQPDVVASSLLEGMAELDAACGWITSTPSGRLRQMYESLGRNSRILLGRKLEYVKDSVLKLESVFGDG